MSNPNIAKDSPKTWKPGESGNPNGRPKKGESLTELMREFLERVPEGQKVSYKEAFIQKCFKIAYEKEDPTFAKMIWNYLEGMPKQQLEHTGKDGEELRAVIVVKPEKNPEA